MPSNEDIVVGSPVWRQSGQGLEGPIQGPQLYDIPFIVGSLAVPGKVFENVQAVIASEASDSEKLLTVERSYVASIKHIFEENKFADDFEDSQRIKIAESVGWREVAGLAMRYLFTQEGYYPSPSYEAYLKSKNYK